MSARMQFSGHDKKMRGEVIRLALNEYDIIQENTRKEKNQCTDPRVGRK